MGDKGTHRNWNASSKRERSPLSADFRRSSTLADSCSPMAESSGEVDGQLTYGRKSTSSSAINCGMSVKPPSSSESYAAAATAKKENNNEKTKERAAKMSCAYLKLPMTTGDASMCKLGWSVSGSGHLGNAQWFW